MCDFISWIEFQNDVYFLDNLKLQDKGGRKLLKYLQDNNSTYDICGHGAIRRYYPELKNLGKERECTDFSSPDNFPKEIVNMIKTGNMSNICVYNPPTELLNELGKAEYKKIKQSAYAEYRKIQQPAYAEYKKIEQPAFAEYKKIVQSAYAKYRKIKQSAYAEYKKIKQSAFWNLFAQREYRNPNWN